MIKRVALLVVIFMLSLTAPVLAAEPDSGIIEGQLVNGTEGGNSVAYQDITLNTYLDDTKMDSTTTKANADGQFIFTDLSTELGYIYDIAIIFQQAEYYSDWLSFDEGETTKSIEIIIYNSTTTDEAIKVSMALTIIYVEQGSLWVEEILVFANESDLTYIGSKEITPEGDRETLRFSLPNEATELQTTQGLMECCIFNSEGGFSDTMPVLPGAREVVYSYKVNYNSGAYTFSQGLNYPTATYSLLAEGESTKVASDHLAAKGLMEYKDRLFNHLLGTDFAPGDILAVRLSGLPKTSNQKAIIWVGSVLVVLTAGSGFFYRLRKRRLQPVSPEDSPNQVRQKLLVKLAQLDDSFEDGKISEEVYRKLRADTKNQLAKLIQRSKEEGGNG